MSKNDELITKLQDPFDFPHVQMCDTAEIVGASGPCIAFAGPSMLNGGPSLQIFRNWAPDARNLTIFAGYCLPGTLGHDVQAGCKRIQVAPGASVDVRCKVEYMSHSDHTDARGISQMIAQVAPRHVVLVHGAEHPMSLFKPVVERRLRIPCSDPNVGETLTLSHAEGMQRVLVSRRSLWRARPAPAPPGGGLLGLRAAGPAAAAATFTGLLRKRGRPEEEVMQYIYIYIYRCIHIMIIVIIIIIILM